jgi:hypothetical protein
MNCTTRIDVRDPDGIPHEIIGLTILLVTALAAFGLVALATRGLTSAITLVLVPSLVIAFDRRARRTHSRATSSDLHAGGRPSSACWPRGYA